MSEQRTPPYSESICVRWCTSVPGPCVTCGGPVGQGPVGFRDHPEPGPLCDACLLVAEPGLGRLLMVTNAVRELAEAPPTDPSSTDPPPGHLRILVLTVLTKLYHRLESGAWPYRGNLMADFLEQMPVTSADVPLETAVVLAGDLVDEALESP